MKSVLRMLTILFAVATVVLLALPVHAGDKLYWNHAPATPGDWFDPLNWDNTGSSGSTYDYRYITNGGTAEISGGAAISPYLYLGHESGTSGTVVQTGGTHNANVYLGYEEGSQGTYELSGTGEFTAGMLYLGYSDQGLNGIPGRADFRQSGGSVVVTSLIINSDGKYDYTGGTFEVSFRFQNFGVFDANGQPFTLNAPNTGIVDVSTGVFSNMQEASYVGGPETLLMYDAALPPESLFKNVTTTGFTMESGSTLTIPTGRGIYGRGTIVGQVNCQGQLDGWSTIRGGLSVSDSGEVGARSLFGTVDIENTTSGMDSGSIRTSYLYVGKTGTGVFRQTGGTCTATTYLMLGTDPGAEGTYELVDGSLECGYRIQFGSEGTGHFIQEGGTASFLANYGVALGCPMTHGSGTGTIDLRGGIFTVEPYLLVGSSGSGLVTQSGGSMIVNGELRLGSESTGNGTYEMSGGSLTVADLKVARIGVGSFRVTNPGAEITVSNKLTLGTDSTVDLVPGTTIHMTGTTFDNRNRDGADLATLTNLALIYDGHTGYTDLFEVAGEDLGRDLAGFVENFALGAITLEDDSILRLYDLFDNAHRGGVGGSAEALYLDTLTMLPGSTLNLNGKHLYVCDLDYQGGDILNGDLISLLPGDADGNWCVDSADLALWQSNYDPTGVNTNTFAMGDFDGDGLINSADLALWQTNYNPLGPGLAETTPEPTTMLLLGTGALCLAGVLRRRLMS